MMQIQGEMMQIQDECKPGKKEETVWTESMLFILVVHGVCSHCETLYSKTHTHLNI